MTSREGTVTSEGTWPATLGHLPDVLAALDAAAARAGLDDDLLYPIHLAVEEACANVIKHGYRAPDAAEAGPLTLRVEIDPHHVTVTLSDEAPPFDPADAPPPPLVGDVESRPVGGLGWHLIRQMMDEIRHESGPGLGNRLTLIKHRTVSSTG